MSSDENAVKISDDEMPPQALLIDLDNCPHELLDLRKTADHYRYIIACHGSHEPRVLLGMAAILGELIAAGRLSCMVPPETVFHIASENDRPPSKTRPNRFCLIWASVGQNSFLLRLPMVMR